MSRTILYTPSPVPVCAVFHRWEVRSTDTRTSREQSWGETSRRDIATHVYPCHGCYIRRLLQFSKAAESTPSLRRQTIELQQPPVLSNPVNQTKTAEYLTYDEALEATGMFVGSGAVTAGESGESEQYTQPFQVLSWYPR